jgi:hypothetical protein
MAIEISMPYCIQIFQLIMIGDSLKLSKIVLREIRNDSKFQWSFVDFYRVIPHWSKQNDGVSYWL